MLWHTPASTDTVYFLEWRLETHDERCLICSTVHTIARLGGSHSSPSFLLDPPILPLFRSTAVINYVSNMKFQKNLTPC